MIKRWSSTQRAVTLSSGEAELAGVVKGASEGLGLQSVARDLGLEPDLRLHTDSSAALGICQRSGIGKVRHLAVRQLWARERLRDHSRALYKCRGQLNPADLFTKCLDVRKERNVYAPCMSMLRAGGLRRAPAWRRKSRRSWRPSAARPSSPPWRPHRAAGATVSGRAREANRRCQRKLANGVRSSRMQSPPLQQFPAQVTTENMEAIVLVPVKQPIHVPSIARAPWRRSSTGRTDAAGALARPGSAHPVP